jgi:D-tyrosyl-tRNA(Tyr) deacylase
MARVEVEGELVGQIGEGIVVLLGVGKEDEEYDVDYLVDKVVNLRIFENKHGVMNESVIDSDGEILVVSQFTIYGDCRKGRRPSYDNAAPPEMAERLYDQFVDKIRARGIKVETGMFRAMMDVYLINWGPVTLNLDSKKLF